MPYIVWINEIFPEPQGPYQVRKRVRRLQQLYNLRATSDTVYGAIRTLKERRATAQIVQPLDGQRPACYSPEAARLIARYSRAR